MMTFVSRHHFRPGSERIETSFAKRTAHGSNDIVMRIHVRGPHNRERHGATRSCGWTAGRLHCAGRSWDCISRVVHCHTRRTRRSESRLESATGGRNVQMR